MHYGSTWEPLGDHARRYVASAAIRMASVMLILSHLLYRAGILDLADVKHAIQLSDKVWQFGWGLVKQKRRS
jgi:hypothetical protein